MRRQRTRTAFLILSLAIVTVVGVGIAQTASPLPRRPGSFVFRSDRQDSVELDVRGSARALVMKKGTTETEIATDVLSAKLGLHGEIYYIGLDLALYQAQPGGATKQLLPPKAANGPLLLNRDLGMLAYTKPYDFAEENVPDTNGVAVYDLNTGQEKIVAKVSNRTINLFAWNGDALVVEMPPYQPTLELTVLRLNGTHEPMPELSGKIRKTRDAMYPQASFDHRHLAYEVNNGVFVVDLQGRKVRFEPGASAASWTGKGLEAKKAGQIELIKLP